MFFNFHLFVKQCDDTVDAIVFSAREERQMFGNLVLITVTPVLIASQTWTTLVKKKLQNKNKKQSHHDMSWLGGFVLDLDEDLQDVPPCVRDQESGGDGRCVVGDKPGSRHSQTKHALKGMSLFWGSLRGLCSQLLWACYTLLHTVTQCLLHRQLHTYRHRRWRGFLVPDFRFFSKSMGINVFTSPHKL